jgi:hypothetical protein
MLTIAVTLPEGTPPVSAIPSQRGGDELEARLVRVQQRQALSALQSQQFGSVMEQAQSALAVLAAVLQPPAQGKTTKPSTPAAPRGRRKK